MVGGKLVAATRSEIVSVLGDGRSTISELVAATQKDLILATNSEAIAEIAQQGFTLDAVPPRLRAHAGLDKHAMLVGQLNKFQLWNEDAWNALADADLAAIKQPGALPDDLRDLIL